MSACCDNALRSCGSCAIRVSSWCARSTSRFGAAGLVMPEFGPYPGKIVAAYWPFACSDRALAVNGVELDAAALEPGCRQAPR
jgi:hypothetical protein